MDRRKMPIENHLTAALASIKKMKGHSDVTIPSEEQVVNAKEHVDQNEK